MNDAIGVAFIIGGCIVSGMDSERKPAETRDNYRTTDNQIATHVMSVKY